MRNNEYKEALNIHFSINFDTLYHMMEKIWEVQECGLTYRKLISPASYFSSSGSSDMFVWIVCTYVCGSNPLFVFNFPSHKMGITSQGAVEMIAPYLEIWIVCASLAHVRASGLIVCVSLPLLVFMWEGWRHTNLLSCSVSLILTSIVHAFYHPHIMKKGSWETVQISAIYLAIQTSFQRRSFVYVCTSTPIVLVTLSHKNDKPSRFNAAKITV